MTLGGAPCYRIEGVLGDRRLTVWIDRRSFLLRRIDRTMSLGKESRVDSVTTYEPELDGEIPAGALAFAPAVGR